MKLSKGQITILFSEDGLMIELHDSVAAITFAVIKLNAVQTCQALSRLSHCDAEIEVHALNNVGKIHEHKEITFEMPEVDWKERDKVAYDLALAAAPEGWKPDSYFGSRGSFFTKGNKDYARCTVRRWV